MKQREDGVLTISGTFLRGSLFVWLSSGSLLSESERVVIHLEIQTARVSGCEVCPMICGVADALRSVKDELCYCAMSGIRYKFLFR